MQSSLMQTQWWRYAFESGTRRTENNAALAPTSSLGPGASHAEGTRLPLHYKAPTCYVICTCSVFLFEVIWCASWFRLFHCSEPVLKRAEFLLVTSFLSALFPISLAIKIWSKLQRKPTEMWVLDLMSWPHYHALKWTPFVYCIHLDTLNWPHLVYFIQEFAGLGIWTSVGVVEGGNSLTKPQFVNFRCDHVGE